MVTRRKKKRKREISPKWVPERNGNYQDRNQDFKDDKEEKYRENRESTIGTVQIADMTQKIWIFSPQELRRVRFAGKVKSWLIQPTSNELKVALVVRTPVLTLNFNIRHRT